MLVVVAVALLASVAQGLTGFGFALIVLPFFLLVADVRDAVVLSTLLGTVNVALLAVRVWRDVPWQTVLRLLVGTLAGMPFGLAVLLLAPQEALRIGIGLSAVVMAGALARGLRIRSRSATSEIAVGAAAGVLRTSTGMPGPPVVLYLQGRGYSPEAFRAALTMFFLLGSLASIGAFLGADVVTGNALMLTAVALPAVFAGNWTGDRLLRLVDVTLFRRLVLLLLVATALSAVGSSLQRLVG